MSVGRRVDVAEMSTSTFMLLRSRGDSRYVGIPRFFPIMHMVVVRTEVYHSHPWVATALFKAFETAKARGLERLQQTWALPCAVPWLMRDRDEIRELFGLDHWPYGIAKNRAILERMTRASLEQGLSSRKLEVNDLFAAETPET